MHTITALLCFIVVLYRLIWPIDFKIYYIAFPFVEWSQQNVTYSLQYMDCNYLRDKKKQITEVPTSINEIDKALDLHTFKYCNVSFFCLG